MRAAHYENALLTSETLYFLVCLVETKFEIVVFSATSGTTRPWFTASLAPASSGIIKENGASGGG